MKENKKFKIFIVDDHPVVRQGLIQFINDEDDLRVCGEARDIKNAIVNINKLIPDLIIADITLEDGSGLDLISEIRKRFGIPVLVLSMHDEGFYAERALRAGAKGYIMKQEPMATVLKAVHEVLEGGLYLNPEIKDILLNKLFDSTDRKHSSTDKLTNREIEILKQIGDGKTNRHIAAQLCLSVRTIESYKKRIIDKLYMNNTSELIQFAVQWRKDEGKNL